MVGLNILSFGINHTKISISFGLIEIKYWYNMHIQSTAKNSTPQKKRHFVLFNILNSNHDNPIGAESQPVPFNKGLLLALQAQRSLSCYRQFFFCQYTLMPYFKSFFGKWSSRFDMSLSLSSINLKSYFL